VLPLARGLILSKLYKRNKYKLVPISRIYDNAKRMLEINQYLPYPNDIRGHWAEPILRNGQMIGWINGFPDGSLRPDQRITRAEFAAFADRIFDLTAPVKQTFSDTVNHWASPSISKFKALNILICIILISDQMII
jgi:hypothetical protein